MNKLTLSAVRENFRTINGASVNNVLSVIYALIAEGKENGAEALTVRTIMPASKKQAKAHAQAIIEFGKVGQTRTIKRKNGSVVEYTIKPTVDMVLRYFLAEYNKQVPEAKVSARKPKQATRKTKKDSNKQPKVQSANDMK